MSINELIIQYSNEILKSKDKENATQNVIAQINNLTYTSNGESISAKDKKLIIDGIYDCLIPKDSSGRRIILNEKDNQNYLSVLSAISSELSKLQGGN